MTDEDISKLNALTISIHTMLEDINGLKEQLIELGNRDMAVKHIKPKGTLSLNLDGIKGVAFDISGDRTASIIDLLKNFFSSELAKAQSDLEIIMAKHIKELP